MVKLSPSRSFLTLYLIFCLARAKHEITYVVKEESDNGTFIGNILIDAGLHHLVPTGYDMGIQLYEDQVSGLFRVDGESGKLFVAGRIDREAICPQRGGASPSSAFSRHPIDGIDHALSVCQVDFIAHIPPDHWANIAVIVEDINDHAPHFPPSEVNQFGASANAPYVVYISEGVSIGYEVPLHGATDEDTANNAVQSYSLCGNDIDNSTFALKYVLPCELNLIVKGKLDFETKAAYKGQLKACDGGRPKPRCAYQNISIFITDVNDNKPEFEKEFYAVRISEATPVMSIIVVVTAKDADSGDFGKLTYRFGQMYDHKVVHFLDINENTGEIFVRNPLDAKIMSHFKIPIIAQDSGAIPKTGTTMLLVDVDDVNNHPPWIEVKPISFVDSSKSPADGSIQLWVEENQPIGTQIGIILTGDKDVGENGEVSCSLKGTDAPFRLRHSNSGQERKMYGLQSKVQFDLEVMPYQLPLQLQVECSDDGNPKLTSRQSIQVNIIDVNEHPAHFTKMQSNLLVHLPEDAPPGSLLVQVQATDHDATPKMKYELVNGGNSLFRIDSTDGRIYTLKGFDREQVEEVRFAVRVTEVEPLDPKTTRKGSEVANVTLIIDDVNDNSPVLESVRAFTIPENRPAYSELIGQLKASDPDLGENGTVRFIASNSLFDINPLSGKIYAKAVLDRELVSQYQLEVEITDLGRPFPRKTLERVIINVEDVNDHKPIWRVPERGHQQVSINAVSSIIRGGGRYAEFDGIHCIAFVNASHRLSPPMKIVKLVASDADAGSNANLTYSIVGGNHYGDGSFVLDAQKALSVNRKPQPINVKEHFQLNQAKWIVSVVSTEAASSGKSGLFELILRVSDNGRPQLHSDGLLYIEYRKNGGLGTSVVGILHRSKSAILFFIACLLACSIIFPAVICSIRSRRKSSECSGRSIFTCVSGEGARRDDPPNNLSVEVGNWAKEQTYLAQQPFRSSFDIAEEMSASLMRCPPDREAVSLGRRPAVQCQLCPSGGQISGYPLSFGLEDELSGNGHDGYNSFGRRHAFYPTSNIVETQAHEMSDYTRDTTLLDTTAVPSPQGPVPYSTCFRESLPNKQPYFTHEKQSRKAAAAAVSRGASASE